MPNHCYNKLEIYSYGEENSPSIEEIKQAITSRDQPAIDFNKIIPRPEILNRTVSGAHTFKDAEGNEITARSWFEGEDGKSRLPTPEEQAELDEIGCNNWYDWSIRYWGTKWNAYDEDIIEEDSETYIICFHTAWGPPEPVITKLREMYPDVHIGGHFIGEGNEFAGVF